MPASHSRSKTIDCVLLSHTCTCRRSPLSGTAFNNHLVCKIQDGETRYENVAMVLSSAKRVAILAEEHLWSKQADRIKLYSSHVESIGSYHDEKDLRARCSSTGKYRELPSTFRRRVLLSNLSVSREKSDMRSAGKDVFRPHLQYVNVQFLWGRLFGLLPSTERHAPDTPPTSGLLPVG